MTKAEERRAIEKALVGFKGEINHLPDQHAKRHQNNYFHYGEGLRNKWIPNKFKKGDPPKNIRKGQRLDRLTTL